MPPKREQVRALGRWLVEGRAGVATEVCWSRTSKSYSIEGSSSGCGSSLGDELLEECSGPV